MTTVELRRMLHCKVCQALTDNSEALKMMEKISMSQIKELLHVKTTSSAYFGYLILWIFANNAEMTGSHLKHPNVIANHKESKITEVVYR